MRNTRKMISGLILCSSLLAAITVAQTPLGNDLGRMLVRVVGDVAGGGASTNLNNVRLESAVAADSSADSENPNGVTAYLGEIDGVIIAPRDNAVQNWKDYR